ncbi:hypothetical protein VM1G_09231 [Cytospora mali]|uniref:NadR/Ttd14 AAA domain-containing protein n=1 Tax=Cytospora mali TaxID=578113 RepID=A0A194WC02_CYTMA|nr:hypothetical protein VM1G_09231 [Valsa mali]
MQSKQYGRNIYLIGAQSTGKTTLFNALRRCFLKPEDSEKVPQFIEETARIVFKQEGFEFAAVDTLSNFDKYLSVQRTILRAQLKAEDEAVKKGNWFISDRSGLDCLIYASNYIGREGAGVLSQMSELGQLKARMQEGRIIVCEPVADWLKDDGTGFRPIPKSKEHWFAIHQEFCQLLDDLGWNYEVLPSGMTSLEERVAFVRHGMNK